MIEQKIINHVTFSEEIYKACNTISQIIKAQESLFNMGVRKLFPIVGKPDLKGQCICYKNMTVDLDDINKGRIKCSSCNREALIFFHEGPQWLLFIS